MVGISFVRDVRDIILLRQELAKRQISNLGIVLKIETKCGFKKLPLLILEAMKSPNPLGVMIARGDLAVECGYEACVCYVNKKENKIASGLLEHLFLHSVEINALHSKGSDAKYKFKPPENPCDLKWFTRLMLERFLHITCSPHMLDVTNAIRREMSQLEEARRFHLSLYAKDMESEVQSGRTDSSSSHGSSSTPKTEGSDASK